MLEWMKSWFYSPWFNATCVGLAMACRRLAKKIEIREQHEEKNQFDHSVSYGEGACISRLNPQQAKELETQVRAKTAIRRDEERAGLEQELPVVRERFRRTLEGFWSNPEVIPCGYTYEFYADGIGIMTFYSGLSASQSQFAWRSIADWTIEINVDYSIGESCEPEEENVENEEDTWQTIAYDFVIACVGYTVEIVLCSKANAQNFSYVSEPTFYKLDFLDESAGDGPLVNYSKKN